MSMTTVLGGSPSELKPPGFVSVFVLPGATQLGSDFDHDPFASEVVAVEVPVVLVEKQRRQRLAEVVGFDGPTIDDHDVLGVRVSNDDVGGRGDVGQLDRAQHGGEVDPVADYYVPHRHVVWAAIGAHGREPGVRGLGQPFEPSG